MLSPWGPRMLPSVYLQDMWSAFFVQLKKGWFESHNYSDKRRRLATPSPVQPERKNGTSYIDLASQQAYSLAQSCASGHVHEVVHTLRHLLASCYPCRGAQVELTIPAHQRTYPSTTTHPPCLPSCFWMFEHWPALTGHPRPDPPEGGPQWRPAQGIQFQAEFPTCLIQGGRKLTWDSVSGENTVAKRTFSCSCSTL